MTHRRTRQGQCDRCRIAWTWTNGVLLRDQVCPGCHGKLRRVNRKKTASAAARAESGYTWIEMNGYSASGAVTKGTQT